MAPENNFQDLQRLLALKRHELPPPGYFHRFSAQVIARIEAGEASGQLPAGASWLQRFWAALETKPLLAGGFSAAVCALLVTGVIYSGKIDPSVADLPISSGVFATEQTGQAPVIQSSTLASAFGAPASTAPIPSPQQTSSFFEELRRSQPANGGASIFPAVDRR